jgi:hypothetical protein
MLGFLMISRVARLLAPCDMRHPQYRRSHRELFFQEFLNKYPRLTVLYRLLALHLRFGTQRLLYPTETSPSCCLLSYRCGTLLQGRVLARALQLSFTSFGVSKFYGTLLLLCVDSVNNKNNITLLSRVVSAREFEVYCRRTVTRKLEGCGLQRLSMKATRLSTSTGSGYVVSCSVAFTPADDFLMA